jgi:2-keto-3-deoxy-L-rhamnonate aldolase RhmA
VAERNAGNVLVINIESTPALANLDAILSVPGVDAVQVGPHDLSCSLGFPEQYMHPVFLEKIEYIISTSRRHGVGVGIHFWNDLQQEVKWGKMGANLIMHSGDITLFSQKLREDLRQFREALRDSPPEEQTIREAAV